MNAPFTSDLVTRLRRVSSSYRHPEGATPSLMSEAADEIEKLLKQLFEICNQRDNLAENVHRLTTKPDRQENF